MEDYGRRKAGAAGQRREGAREQKAKRAETRVTEEQTEARFSPEKGLHQTSPRSSTRSVMEKSGSPVLLPSPPHGTIGPFLPRVQDKHQPHFLLRCSLKLRTFIAHMICASFQRILLSSDWPAHSQYSPPEKHHVLNCLRPTSRAPNLKGAALRSLDSWLSYCFELDGLLPLRLSVTACPTTELFPR